MFRFILVLLLCSAMQARAQVAPCGKKGFERLVLMANATEVSEAELAEALVIADTLQKINCRDYEVQRFGKTYASASLTWLLGQIVAKRGDSAAVAAFIAYADDNGGSAEEEISYQLEALMKVQPRLLLAAGHLYDRIAWGFVNNPIQITRQNYKEQLFRRHPRLKELYPTHTEKIDRLLRHIEEYVD